ncbi:MAG TPA: hypothetical protein VG274_04940, partial [Rhizomicrobium sp.]|nr:hypothetical protein [Rhizomicrobium sp.]
PYATPPRKPPRRQGAKTRDSPQRHGRHGKKKESRALAREFSSVLSVVSAVAIFFPPLAALASWRFNLSFLLRTSVTTNESDRARRPVVI